MSGYVQFTNADGFNFTNVSVAEPLPVMLPSGSTLAAIFSNAAIAWTNVADVTTSAAAATDILAAGLATNCLIVANVHASESVRIRFDGNAATSGIGIPLAAGKALKFEGNQVPAGKISGYSTNASTVSVAYC